MKEVKAAATAIIQVMEQDGQPLPAVGVTLASIQSLQSLMNMSAVAKAAKVSVQWPSHRSSF